MTLTHPVQRGSHVTAQQGHRSWASSGITSTQRSPQPQGAQKAVPMPVSPGAGGVYRGRCWLVLFWSEEVLHAGDIKRISGAEGAQVLVGCRWGGEGRFPRALPPSSGLGARGEERELVSGSDYTQRGEGKSGGRALVGTSLSSQSPGSGGGGGAGEGDAQRGGHRASGAGFALQQWNGRVRKKTGWQP